MNDIIMTIRDVAQILKLGEKTVYAMCGDGELPAFKVRGQWRVRRVDFERWLANQAGSAPVETERSSAGKKAMNDIDDEPAIEDLTPRVTQENLHKRFVDALGMKLVRSHSHLSAKPLELDLVSPLPHKTRVYIFNATRPPGGRPVGEHKIQLILQGQKRGERASFDNGGGRIVLLVGYAAEEKIFILWDAGLYTDFAWSRNVQVKAETIIQATAGKIATQERHLRPPSGAPVREVVLAAEPARLAEAIKRRMELTRERLANEEQ